MVFDQQLNYQSVLDGMGQAILIFDKEDRLVMDNLAARTLLGADLKLIRANGWPAASALFNSRASVGETADAARQKARESARPVRFQIYRAGEFLPCWASIVHGQSGETYTMVSIEQTDWAALSELLTHFRDEVETAASSTFGNTKMIQGALRPKPNDTVETVSRRISGFVNLITTQMHRLERLMHLFHRLELIRTGKLHDVIRAERRKVNLEDFMEDFMEGLDEITLIDPESEQQDYRSRITCTVAKDLNIYAAPSRLTAILHDLLRNAIMYSMVGTPIIIMAHAAPGNQSVQLDVVDEGYGIWAKEFERVFALFQRARQPQIIGEFGYGLSLYLCKHEVEAMNGKIWFESEENVGTTFSFKLPVWRDDSSSSSSDSE